MRELEEETLAAQAASWAALVWRHRRLVLLVVGLVSVVTAGGTFLLRPRYTAEASLLPHGGAAGIGNVLSQLSGLSGQNLADPGVDLYPVASRSRTVLQRVYAMPYHGAPLIDYLLRGKPNTPRQVFLVTKKLRTQLASNKDLRNNVVRIEFTHTDPEFAAFVVNAILTQMDAFFREAAGAEAMQERKLIELRIEQVGQELAAAEEALKRFRLANRVTVASPLLLLAEGRLVRQVEIKNRVYLELAAQLEVTKVREAGSVSALRVLDHAEVPQEKSWPRRSIIVMTVAIATFLVLARWLRLKEARQTPEA